MQPRLPNSHKWTPFPEEFTEKILQVFGENFSSQASQGEFIVDGRIYSQEILLRIGYLEKGRLKQVNFEASMEYSQQSEELNATKAIYATIDALGSVMDEYFTAQAQNEEIQFPATWEAFEFEDGIVWLQHSTVNTRLEAEADKILSGEGDKALVYEPSETEDALERALIDTDLALDVQEHLRRTKNEPEKQH